MYFQKIFVPFFISEAYRSYGQSMLVHTNKIQPNLEILNACNSETIQLQGLKFHLITYGEVHVHVHQVLSKSVTGVRFAC